MRTSEVDLSWCSVHLGEREPSVWWAVGWKQKKRIYASLLQLLMDIIWGGSYFHFCLYSVVLNNATLFKQKFNVTSVKAFYTALYNSFIFLYKYKNSPETPQGSGNLRSARNDGFGRISSSYSLMVLEFRWKLSSSDLQITDIRYLEKNIEGGLSSYKKLNCKIKCFAWRWNTGRSQTYKENIYNAHSE